MGGYNETPTKALITVTRPLHMLFQLDQKVVKWNLSKTLLTTILKLIHDFVKATLKPLQDHLKLF